jgi:hypothetical protein
MTRQNSWNFDTTYTVGDVLYADTTSTLTKLNPGTDGQVLTLSSGVPSWQNSAASSGWVLIQEITGSAASYDFTTGISSSYVQFVIVYNFGSSADSWLRVSSDGGSTWVTTNSYYYRFAGASQVNTSRILIDNAAGAVGQIQLNGLNQARITTAYGSANQTDSIFASIGTNTAYNAIQLLPASGSITSGFARLYGITAA